MGKEILSALTIITISVCIVYIIYKAFGIYTITKCFLLCKKNATHVVVGNVYKYDENPFVNRCIVVTNIDKSNRFIQYMVGELKFDIKKNKYGLSMINSNVHTYSIDFILNNKPILNILKSKEND